MAELFLSNAGLVTRLVLDESAVPGSIELIQSKSTSNIDTRSKKAELFIITGVDYSQTTNHQFQSSLGTDIYLYIFGDKIGSVVVTGYAFIGDCDGNDNGITDILNFYDSNKISNTKSDDVPLIKMRIGSADFLYCYLIDCRIVMTDPSIRLAQFSLTLRSIPRESIING